MLAQMKDDVPIDQNFLSESEYSDDSEDRDSFGTDKSMEEMDDLQKAMLRLRTLEGSDLFRSINTIKEDHRRKSVIDRSLLGNKRQNMTRD